MTRFWQRLRQFLDRDRADSESSSAPASRLWSRSDLLILFGVFIVVFLSHLPSRVAPFTDSRWTVYIAMSVIKEGNTNLDEYAHLRPREDYRTVFENGHLASTYPLGTPLICVPLVYVLDKTLFYLFDLDLEQYLKETRPVTKSLLPRIEVAIASCIVAATAVFIYLIGRFQLTPQRALLLVFIFAFCTSAWSTGSLSLWPHGPSMLMLAITLYLLGLARTRPWLTGLISVPLLLACIIRPTNFLSAFFLLLYGAVMSRKQLVGYLLTVCAVFVPCLLFFPFLFKTASYGDFAHYHALFTLNRLPLDTLAGQLFSPNRGLFVFTPILLFSVYGAVRRFRNGTLGALDVCLIAILLAHWAVISQFRFGWHSGHAFGPRYFADVLPYFMVFLIPAINRLFELSGVTKGIVAAIFAVCVAISFFIHFKGANCYATWRWNAVPPAELEAHVWDWRDLQFLR